MSTAPGVARNSLLLLTAQIVARVAGLVTFMLMARRLAPSEIGIFGYALSLVGFLVLAVDFGFDMLVTREVARGGVGFVPAVLRLKSTAFALFYPVLIFVGWLLTGRSMALGVVAILGAAVWHESAYRTVGAARLGQGDARFTLTFETVSSALRLLLVAVVLFMGGRVGAVAAAYFAATAAAALALIGRAWRRGDLALRTGRDSASPLSWALREAAGFAIYSLLFQAYFRIDMVALGALRPAAEVGEYVAAFRVIETLLVVPAVLTGALYPVLSALHGAGATEAFARRCGQGTRWVVAAVLAMVLVAGVAAALVIRVLAGPGYDRAPLYLVLLLPALVLIALNCIGLLALNATGHQRWNVWIMGAGAFTKLAWTLALVPRYGAVAACIGTVVTELVVTTAIVLSMRPWYPLTDWFAAWRGAAIAGAGAFVVALLAPDDVWVRLAAASATFGLLAVLSGAVRREDLATVRGLVTGRTSPTVSTI